MARGTPPSGGPDPGPPRPEPPQHKKQSADWARKWLEAFSVGAMLGIVFFVVPVVVTLIVFAVTRLGGDSTDTVSDKAEPAAKDSPEDSKAARKAYIERKKYWRQMDRKAFAKLATPKKRCHGKGRFIQSGIHGIPAEKLNRLLKCAAQDRTSLVGLMKAQTNGEYPAKYLSKAFEKKQASPAHYRVWNDYRALLTAPRANIASIRLNGKYQNSGLTEGGAVTVTPASYQDVRGSRIVTPAQQLPSGAFVSGQSAKYKHDCSNRQFPAKVVPPFAVPTPVPGKIPPPPSEAPPTEERHPAVTDDDLNRGGPLPQQEGSEPGSDHRRIPGGNTNPPPKGTATGGDQGGGPGGSNEGPAPGSDSTGATNPGEPEGPIQDTGQGSTGEVPTGESEEPDWGS